MKPIARFKDMIVFSFNPRGHGNSQDDVKGKPSDFWIRGLDNKEGYYYRAYLDCVRAVDFLCSEVDSKRIAVRDKQSRWRICAMINRRLTNIDENVPLHIPFLTNWDLDHWPEMDKWIEKTPSSLYLNPRP